MVRRCIDQADKGMQSVKPTQSEIASAAKCNLLFGRVKVPLGSDAFEEKSQ